MITQNVDLGAQCRGFSSGQHTPHFCSQQGMREVSRRVGQLRERSAVAGGT